MQIINLISNCSEEHAATVLVSNKTLKELKTMQYSGGFLRFNLSIQEDNVPYRSKPMDYSILSSFLSRVFTLNQLTKPKKP
jgi:hypothetical protein